MKTKFETSASFILGIFFSLFVALPALRAADDSSRAQVNVILWFDTEDYLLPADDDAAKMRLRLSHL